MRRCTLGRLAIYIEPRDLWVGIYIAPAAVYVLPFPMLVFRWTRRTR
ncbi:hypothetical protein SAMN05421811_12735 [Nonomuraea wenchangensis]|uniref:Uncharacterized protein n=1 Tax=Nonomuraea wenchangensis TaxID=568860 RepID=A0A1I0LTK7_9ACTN|nr:hypothetical protein SAMN05421811_12735 [Nonomuraea wenchangensis]